MQSHFDVAHMIGHAAFEHLAAAVECCCEPAKVGYDKPMAHDWQQCLQISAEISALRKRELSHCSTAVILFQAMMEKAPIFLQSVGRGMSPPGVHGFRNMWLSAISQIQCASGRANAEQEFDQYHNEIYQGMRNPLVHGKSAADVKAVASIRTSKVYEGVKCGWRAYDRLIENVFLPEQQHQPSWEAMCQAHRVPNTLDSAPIANLEGLEREYLSRHLAGARGTR